MSTFVVKMIQLSIEYRCYKNILSHMDIYTIYMYALYMIITCSPFRLFHVFFILFVYNIFHYIVWLPYTYAALFKGDGLI